MARMPYAEIEKAHPRVREAFEALPAKLNVFRMMAHAERNFVPLLQLGGTILARQQLSAKLRELAILFVASESHARYEWVQHVPIARRAGVRDDQIAALERGDLETGFDAEERVALRFARELLRDVRPSDAALDAMKQRFSPREIVELVLAVGYYMMLARLMETTGLELEPPAGTKVVDALGR
jgi:alkylhydroperoxidase family enzyme